MATRGRRLAQGDSKFAGPTGSVPKSRPSGPSTVANVVSAGPAVPRARGPLMSGDAALGVLVAGQSVGNGSAAALSALRSKLR